jgi:hypothetical protein
MSLSYTVEEEEALQKEYDDFCKKYDADHIALIWPRMKALEETTLHLSNVIDNLAWTLEHIIENVQALNAKLNKHVQ